MKYIQVQDSVVIVDDEDFEELSKFKWYLDNKGYPRRNNNDVYPRTTIRMHQQVFPVPVGQQVDHRNGDKLDNRRENLRQVCPTNQVRNMGMKSNNSSGFKGVNFYPKSRRWRAYITFERKPITIGYFDSPVDAARAYDEKAMELFGEFARTNEDLGNYK